MNNNLIGVWDNKVKGMSPLSVGGGCYNDKLSISEGVMGIHYGGEVVGP